MTEIEMNVKRGAALLDERQPDWYKWVIPEQLKMGYCDQCILGQIYDHFDAGCEILGIGCGIAYGFDVNFLDDEVLYKDLADLWKEEIQSRLEADIVKQTESELVTV
jgi:hypothetical protein